MGVGVYVLLTLFFMLFIFTRNNIANILTIFPVIAILIYVIILPDQNTWIQIGCEVSIIVVVLIALTRVVKRA